ncbi:probable cytosolic oligopeptidase A [Centruroides sculpturatus]|uniref:probable cytosolic oligopeptidase A n=1 Tax=Centruroides sculpturatus TaxID=218467 RepID=UPI000C6EF5EF|nr:probable cytosolic oligopeptidase A [Centruroides sculpturatus]
MAGYTLAEQLYKSALDLELYSKRDFWLDISRHVWMCYMPLPFDQHDNHLCSFREIFCDEFPASYFSFLWSEMVAADVFSAFWEVGLDNKKQIKEIGRRYVTLVYKQLKFAIIFISLSIKKFGLESEVSRLFIK